MKHFVIALVLWAASFAPTAANEAEIKSTIQAQLDAFQDDDFVSAFEIAAPNIRSIFGPAERFGAMVQKGYPMVYRPSDVLFLTLERLEDEIWQKIEIRDAQGQYHILAYKMIYLDGVWRIEGVRLMPTRDVGV